MHILNIHNRIYDVPKDEIVSLLNTLSSSSDEIWPKEKWPRMKLDKGLAQGSKGGHGPIKYFIESHIPGKQTVFRFTNPSGFHGVHRFDINIISDEKTELVHTIDMHAKGAATLLWYSGIRWLHDALIEDGLDKIHNKINNDSKVTEWSLWVKFLRSMLK